MKISIIFYSQGGNTKRVADLIAEGAVAAGDVEVKAMNLDEIDEAFVDQSDAVIFGTPTYYGMFCWQIKKFFDTTKLKLAGKLGSVYATENFLGGGADAAELGLAGHMLVRGMLVYTGGTSDGKPYTHFGAVTIKDGNDFEKDRAKTFGQRIAKKALELFG